MITYMLKILSGSVEDEWEGFDPRGMDISNDRSNMK